MTSELPLRSEEYRRVARRGTMPSTDFGPFSVAPAQVSGLGGANFGQFVSRLLAAETAAHEMAGAALETTYLENVGDGGVDAGLRGAGETTWIPAGDSAWQFKAGNLSPAACKTELEGATKAIKILRAGGSYRLVLGASLTSAKIDARRTQLKEAVRALGIDGAEYKVDVISADGLARWIETYPALAVHPLLRASGVIGQTFEGWSSSIRHTTTWVSSAERDQQIETLRTTIESGSQLDVHLDGVSGLGKTRLVLEGMRGRPYEALVVYAPAADSFPVSLLTQLQLQGRAAVVVIDECDRKQHEIYAQALTTGTSIRLITIGEPGGSSTRTPMISLRTFGDEPMRELLRTNRPSLSPEAERLVVDVAAGNIDYALKLADVAIMRTATSAGALITEEDLRAFFTNDLPEGQFFLASSALALFSRFGMDGELGAEIDVIGAGLGLSASDLRTAAVMLQARGLISQQGRYRAVGPHPVAVYLASKAWLVLGERIVNQLLPTIAPDLTERLFRRAAEVGGFEQSSPAIAAVLSDEGALASIESIAEGENSGLLVHFAVLAPEAVSHRLAGLIGAATEDELLGAQSIRRDLVWTLEKLAWHTGTFIEAADTLLRLALAENESYSNNASGTWVEFFGARLPGTAASPATRINYLQTVSVSSDPRARLLAVKAGARALDMHESIMVSGEVQGGLLVESRGQPSTWAELSGYRNRAIDLLGTLCMDSDPATARAASEALVGAIHGLLESDESRDHLGRVIAGLPSSVVARARIEVESLSTLFNRVDVEDERPAGLEALGVLLPEESPAERLAVLANSQAWDRQPGELAALMAESARQVNSTDPIGVLVDILVSSSSLPSAYSVGQALHLLELRYDEALARLSGLAGTENGEALIGYLHAVVNEGDHDAFDRYLDNSALQPLLALRYSVRGVRTSAATRRVESLVPQVSVVEAARVLLGWMHDADQTDSAELLRSLASRIETQADYNAAVDFAAMQVFRKPDELPELDAAIAELVPRRRQFPRVGQESHDWSTLVRRELESHPRVVVNLIADLIEEDALSVYGGSEEGKLLQDALRLAGADAWNDLMERLLSGEWRLSLSIREWLGNAASVEVAARWVGDSAERARVLASVTDPGGSPLSPTARYLIESFGSDQRVQSSLVAQYVSGMWSGNESERISRQIAEVNGWIAEPGQSVAVQSWARQLVSNLEARRRDVLQEEAERGW